jgi:hypothetical protein
MKKLKKIMFMSRKLAGDFSRKRESYEISKDLHSKNLGEYYFIFHENRISKGKDQALISKFDQDGIPLNKTYIDVPDKETVYFPISIGQMGLSIFHTYLKTNKNEDKNRFMNFVNWFYNNAEYHPDLGVRWMTHVPLPQYRNAGPWQSAFSQSRGISILLRGYQLTNNDKYAVMAEKALIPFTKVVSEGGVTSFTKWGPFYEEYSADVPTLVLNGMIFSLCGVHDFVRVFSQNKMSKSIYDEGIHTLSKILPEYNLKYWSRYNLCKSEWYPDVDPATILYQRLHVVQLKMLFKLTQLNIFNEYAELFKSQDNLWNIMKMYSVKFKSLKKLNRI